MAGAETFKTQALPVTLKAMERARSTLEDFVRSYFMFHGLDEHNPEHLFKHLPVLMFVEAYIYELDEQNEEVLNPSTKNEATECALGVDPFFALRHDLMERNLLTERIEKELKDGVEYWLLEQSLCRAVSNNSEILISEAMQAMHLKSFDYRVLNLLLYRLREQEINEVHFNFLTVSEFLVEISDDLFDYEEDVIDNNFNILRMFLKIYGAKKAPGMLAKCISEAEDKYQELLANLEPEIAARYQKRCEEAVKEGGSKSNHVLGSWTIPPLILDEVAYRSQVMGCNTVLKLPGLP